jgi:predicted glycosyltransferase
MNREAASLDVPVYSIFRGKIGAVDQYLSKTGRLVLLRNIEDLQTKILPVRRERPTRPQDRDSAALSRIVEQMVASMESQRVPSGGTEVATERSAVGR